MTEFVLVYIQEGNKNFHWRSTWFCWRRLVVEKRHSDGDDLGSNPGETCCSKSLLHQVTWCFHCFVLILSKTVDTWFHECFPPNCGKKKNIHEIEKTGFFILAYRFNRFNRKKPVSEKTEKTDHGSIHIATLTRNMAPIWDRKSMFLHIKNKDHFSVVVQIKKFLLNISKKMIISVFVSTDDILKVD